MRDLESRIRSVVRRYLPKGWRVVEWDKQLDGYADPLTRTVRVPRLVTRYALCVFMHEIGHVVLGHCRDMTAYEWHQEFEAEEWARKQMAGCGVSMPNAYREDSRYTIRCMVEKAMNHDDDLEVDDEVLKFCYPDNWREVRDGEPLRKAA